MTRKTARVREQKKIEILCTLGPTSLNEKTILRMAALGVSLFRINLSHTPLNRLEPTIKFIQKITSIPICVDTEGAQIRTAGLDRATITAKEHTNLKLARAGYHKRTQSDLGLYPSCAMDQIQSGDLLSIDFNSVLTQVVSKEENYLEARVLTGGVIGNNKAVSCHREMHLPAFTQKDLAAFKIAEKYKIQHIALSFAATSRDLCTLRSYFRNKIRVIAKIESRQGLLRLGEIIREADALLIDRGDLSREEPIERIPKLQKEIIRQAKKSKRKIYVATNLLEHMVSDPRPTRAEVNDVINTLMDGADGLVLAAETAIGSRPIQCVHMIVKLIHEYQLECKDEEYLYTPQCKSLLVDPHGGELIHREALESDLKDSGKLNRISISRNDWMDCEQIAYGTYSPLTGFMNKAALRTVLEKKRLPDGLPWTMPIVLQVSETVAKSLHVGERIRLEHVPGQLCALMAITEIYTMDMKPMARQWFGTISEEHPGVARFMNQGPWFIAGDIRLMQAQSSAYSKYELTPAQSRFVFSHKGWSRVVGFHTRNVPHGAHEYIQLKALEQTHADGLYVSPVTGCGRPGDFIPEMVIEGYEILVNRGYFSAEQVVLGCFKTYPRFCGPREAVFTALCRKNMGCSHFIIGRNHAGVGQFYPERDYRVLFDELGDLQITPLFFKAVGFDVKTKSYKPLSSGNDIKTISGTQLRNMLQSGKKPPSWFMRKEIVRRLDEKMRSGQEVLFK